MTNLTHKTKDSKRESWEVNVNFNLSNTESNTKPSKSELKLSAFDSSTTSEREDIVKDSKFILSNEELSKENMILEPLETRDKMLTKSLKSSLEIASYDEYTEVDVRLKIRTYYNEIGYDALFKILLDLFFMNSSNDKLVIGLCLALRELSFEEAYPNGPILLIPLIQKTDNVSIVESVLNLIDSWKNKDLIAYLNDLYQPNDRFPKWLNEYISFVSNEIKSL